jgi:hypothetical protein
MGCRAARRPMRALGRRGAFLTLMGGIAALYGYGLCAAPPDARQGPTLLLRLAPLDVWAGAWIAVGACALVCAWAPQPRDWPGFVAVWAVTAPWSMGYLVAWWPLGDYPRGWVPALIFGAFGAVCLVAIGWDEPPRARSEPV